MASNVEVFSTGKLSKSTKRLFRELCDMFKPIVNDEHLSTLKIVLREQKSGILLKIGEEEYKIIDFKYREDFNFKSEDRHFRPLIVFKDGDLSDTGAKINRAVNIFKDGESLFIRHYFILREGESVVKIKLRLMGPSFDLQKIKNK